MANSDHLAILKRGADVWNEWRKNNPGTQPDLIEVGIAHANLNGANLRDLDLHFAGFYKADLREADLSETRLGHANLEEANLSGAHLVYRVLRGAFLSRAVLVNASLHDVDFRWAELGQADLTGSDLREANLTRAVLRGANLTGVLTDRTGFVDVDLSSVEGLETVNHAGPSDIGISTVYRSGGNIPEVFLRGCGVPDAMITFAKSLVGKAVEFYSAFISHSSKDDGFARQLHADL